MIKEFFSSALIDFLPDQSEDNDFVPPTSIPEGTRIRVCTEHLTEEGKKEVDENGYITVGRSKSSVTP